MYLTKIEVLGFEFFPSQMATDSIEIGQIHFVSKNYITDIVAGLTYSSITHGLGQIDNLAKGQINIKDMEALAAFSESLKTFSNIKGKPTSYAPNRLFLSDEQKKQVQQAIIQAESVFNTINDHLYLLDMKYRACASQKKSADAAYSRGLAKNDGALIEGGYQDASEYGICETQLRIEINAYKPLQQKILKYITILKQKN